MKNWLLEILKKYIFSLFPFVIVFIASLHFPADSDLGWHLKYGEYFLKNGKILRENIFSASMPNYKWVNSSWGTDLITYFIFDNSSFMGLSVAGAALITGTLYLLSKAANLTFFQKSIIFPLFLYFEKPLFQVSFRGHLITIFFFALLFFFIQKFETGNDKKAIYLTIPLFLLWANMHGEFVLGLLIYYLVGFSLISLSVFKKNILPVSLLASLVLSTSVTLVNPFGLGLYLETFKHFGNPLQRFIIEWLPFEKYSPLWWMLIFFSVIVLFSLLSINNRKKIEKTIHLILPLLVLTILSFWMRRYTWVAAVSSIFIISHLVSKISPKREVLSKISGVIIFLAFYAYVIFFHLPKLQPFNQNWQRYCRDFIGCSDEAARFIIDNNLTTNLFTFYNWGGWLIYRYYPHIVPSIDGRMHLWKDDTGHSAFLNYYRIEQGFTDIDNSHYQTVLINKQKPLYSLLLQKEKRGEWKIAYEDNFAAVFIRS